MELTKTLASILIFLIMVVIIVMPAVLIVMDFVFFIRKKEKPVFELIAFSAGAVYTMAAFIIWECPSYDKPVNIYATVRVHEPFSTKYFFILAIAAVIGFSGYFLLKFKKDFPPLVKVFLLASVYIGCTYNILWIVQLLCGASTTKSSDLPKYVTGVSGFSFMPLCLCTVPVLFLIHCGHMMLHLIKNSAKEQAQKEYKNPVLQKLNTFLIKGTNQLFAGFIMLLPILGIVVAVLCFFGQQPDSLLYAFTKTSDWILSKEISPPPVAFDVHYLCTVSLRGHKKLVKPTRYGIRKGEKIVVNRQLCVANAFEELIMEKTPGLHKVIRHVYDTYGYPVSKHINNAWSADLVYILMKPLEWFFILVLYMVDMKPEDRICRQYLPKIM